MELKIRAVSKEIVSQINEQAKHQKLSREEYLRQLLVRHIKQENLERDEQRYQQFIQEIRDQGERILSENTRALQILTEKMEGTAYAKKAHQFS